MHPARVTRRSLGLVASGFLSCVLLHSSVLAQSVNLTAGFYVYAPGVYIHVLREERPEPSLGGSPVCTGYQTQPLECDMMYGGDTIPESTKIGVDAVGDVYHTGPSNIQGDILDPSGNRIGIGGMLVLRTHQDGASEEPVVMLIRSVCGDPCPTMSPPTYWYRPSASFDATNGRIVIEARGEVYDSTGHLMDKKVGLVAIDGLPKMFDTLMTFTPGGALSALNPGLPDGFRSVDAMQIWTGDVRSMPDWSQAQPLACMAATSPTPGQIVTVPDTLPNPPVGHGRYYLTATVSGTDRRLGRQYVNGAFSARNPTGLPICTP
jgi:hypothetical protein